MALAPIDLPLLKVKPKASRDLLPKTLKIIQHRCVAFMVDLNEPGQSGRAKDFGEPRLSEFLLVRCSYKSAIATKLLGFGRPGTDRS
jgi:hypothetical protein